MKNLQALVLASSLMSACTIATVPERARLSAQIPLEELGGQIILKLEENDGGEYNMPYGHGKLAVTLPKESTTEDSLDTAVADHENRTAIGFIDSSLDGKNQKIMACDNKLGYDEVLKNCWEIKKSNSSRFIHYESWKSLNGSMHGKGYMLNREFWNTYDKILESSRPANRLKKAKKKDLIL